MTTAHLALNRLASPPQALRYLLGTPTQIGNDFTAATAEEGPDSNADMSMHAMRICQFKGSNDLYAGAEAGVWQYNSGTGAWASVFTGWNTLNGSGRIGPLVMPVNGVPTLVAVGNPTSDGGEYQIATSTDGTTWNTSATIVLTNQAGKHHFWSPMVVGELLYVFWMDTGPNNIYLLTINPGNETISSIDLAATSPVVANGGLPFLDQIIFNGRHYVIGRSASTIATPGIYEFDGASFTNRWNYPNAHGHPAPSSYAEGRYGLFTDGTTLFALASTHQSGGDFGWYCYEFSESGGVLTPTDITATVLPAGLRTVGTFDAGVGVVVDQEANPGGVPEIWLYFRADGNAATPWSVYKWNGNAALIGNAGAPNDSGGSAQHGMAFQKNGTGKVFWTEDELDMSIEDISGDFGGETISFRLYSASGTETVNVDFYYGLDGETATQAATLSNASAGTIVGTQIQGLTADNGATLYTVKWEAETDGLSGGDTAQLQGRVSV